jgi:hypothetical protein
VAELRTLAGGRGDLLAEQAGIMAGAWSARADTGDFLLAAGLLVMARRQSQRDRPLGRRRPRADDDAEAQHLAPLTVR